MPDNCCDHAPSLAGLGEILLAERSEIGASLWHTQAVASSGQIGGPDSNPWWRRQFRPSTAPLAILGGVLLVLAVIATGCSTGTVGTAERVLPTPRPLPEPTTDPNVFVPTVAPASAPTAVPVATSPPGEPVVFVTDVDLDVYPQPGGQGDAIGLVLGSSQELPILGPPFQGDDGRIWWLIRDNTLQGWVTRPLPALGAERDVLAEVSQLLGSDPYPSADELALAVADIYASTDPPSQRSIIDQSPDSRITTVDVTLDGDDSLAGVRLIITLTETNDAALAASDLVSVVQRPLCARGVTADGLCT